MRTPWAMLAAVGCGLLGALCATPGADAAVRDVGLLAVRTSTGIEVAALDGSNARMIAEGTYASDPSWSADGKRITYIGTDSHLTMQVWVARADGSHAHTVSPLSQGNAVHWPSFSPDGRITYTYGTRLMVVNADGTGLHQLAHNVMWATWTPDGRMVLLRTDPYHLEVGRADGTTLRTTNPPNPDAVLPSTPPWQFAPDGLVAYRFADAAIGDTWVEYMKMTGRQIRDYEPVSYVRGPTAVALDPNGGQSVIARGGNLSIWSIDSVSGTQTYEGDGFAFIPSDWGVDLALQPTCTIESTASSTTISGTPYRDRICVTGHNDVIQGLGGNDVIYAKGEHNVVRGGRGRDVLVAHGKDDRVYGGRGSDVINVQDRDGSDLVRGGRLVDVCIADPGDAVLSCRR